MRRCGPWILLSLLWLAHAEDDTSLADDYDMYQREVDLTFPMQQREVDLPLLVLGEPVLAPRGRSPGFPSGNLNGFPPGKPTRGNIGNICRKSRPKIQYGPDNLPRSGFGHLSRQGDAINQVEAGYSKCCSQSNKLSCAVEEWTNAMVEFCESEFVIKTRHYHCCKKEEAERESCFINEAPNPSYTSSSSLQEISSDEDVLPLVRSRSFKPLGQEMGDSRNKLSELAFPPGEPTSSNIQNICKLRKFRPMYPDDALPKFSFGHYGRRAKAINRAEKEYKKCCKNEDVACAHTGWKKVLSDFCSKELRVKTRHHECCQKEDERSMFSCFASEAPFPKYDKEIENLNLGDISEDVLEKICKDCKLLTKQKQLPLLVSGLKESCCSLPQDKKLACAQEQKENFIKTVCGPNKDLWKDTQSCCSKDGLQREKCFSGYLQISLAVSQRKGVGEE
ncbi:extracellular matrix protein 1 [Gastrophryne carolinensis]